MNRLRFGLELLIQTDCVTYDTIVGVVHITTVVPQLILASVDLAIDALVPTTK